MLWRVRTTLDDRPGALAELAAACGEAGVNILGLQVFPGSDAVTDELVLRAPDGWPVAEVTALLEGHGRDVVAQPCTEAALTDQPTRYVEAARSILTSPSSFPDVVARLFDAEADPAAPDAPAQDSMEMTVGDVLVQVRRTAPFTATEHARGAAMAGLVSDVLRRSRDSAMVSGSTGRRLGEGLVPEYVVEGATISAVLGETVVGVATVGEAMEEPEVRPIDLRVDPGFQRRGIGTRLLVDAARLARGMGAAEILLTTRSDNQAVLPMVLAANLRGRIRMAADRLVVRVPVRDLKPLGR